MFCSSGLEDEYSDMIAETAGASEVLTKNSNNGTVGNDDDDDDDKYGDAEDGNDYVVCTRRSKAPRDSKPER